MVIENQLVAIEKVWIGTSMHFESNGGGGVLQHVAMALDRASTVVKL